jgi:hypothetical protein
MGGEPSCSRDGSNGGWLPRRSPALPGFTRASCQLIEEVGQVWPPSRRIPAHVYFQLGRVDEAEKQVGRSTFQAADGPSIFRHLWLDQELSDQPLVEKEPESEHVILILETGARTLPVGSVKEPLQAGDRAGESFAEGGIGEG